MTLIDARLVATAFSYPATGRLKAAASAQAGAPLVFGARPEDICVSADSQPNRTRTRSGAEGGSRSGAIRASVYMSEPLGRENLLTLQVGNSMFKVLASPDIHVNLDQSVWLTCNEERVHLFEQGTGSPSQTPTAHNEKSFPGRSHHHSPRHPHCLFRDEADRARSPVESVRDLFVVSHTHWDREWYRSFHQYRMQLLNVIDRLLDLMARVPEFKHFFLDGQTVMLEDYLELRPERADAVRSWSVKAGSISALGMWSRTSFLSRERR